MKMSPWWMFMILVCCRLSHNAESQNTCASNNQLKSVCVPVGDKVSVPCPKSPGKEVKFILLQDRQMIYNHTCSNGKDALNCEPVFSEEGVELHENAENKSVSFILTGVNASSHGIFRCEGIVIVPPPLITVASDLRVLVLVEGHQCRKVCRNDTTDGDQKGGFHWIWIIVLVVSTYGVIVTIIAIIIWIKLRTTDSHTDYMNTKPKATRACRKKRGVQNPIPRHF